MNKKGFTLVEVLGVIVLLAVVGIVAGRFINGNVDKTKKTISSSQKASILNAVEKWSVENTGLLEEKNSDTKVAGSINKVVNNDINMCVTTDYLYKEGYINTKDIKLEDNSSFSGYIIIKYDNNTKQYVFSLAVKDSEINSCKKHIVTND